MTEIRSTTGTRRWGKAQAVGLVAGGLVVGAILAGTLGASAASSASSPSGTSSSSSSYAGPAGPGGRGHGGSSPVRGDEKSVTSAQSATINAAALKAVPGGTVYRIETDAGDGSYEAHMTKSDGTEVTVKFDDNLAVTKVESGMGSGDPAPGGAPQPGGASSGG